MIPPLIADQVGQLKIGEVIGPAFAPWHQMLDRRDSWRMASFNPELHRLAAPMAGVAIASAQCCSDAISSFAAKGAIVVHAAAPTFRRSITAM